MPSSPNEDLPEAIAIHLVGMGVPVAVVAAARELLALYVSGEGFIAVAAVAFALVGWLLIEEWEIDRPNFLVAAVVGPFLAFGAIVGYAVLTSGYAETYRYLFDDGGIFGYPAAFTVAGFVAVGLSKKVRDLADRDDRVPEPRVAFTGVVGVVAGVAVLLLGANLAAAHSVTVASVDPGVEEIRDPALNVTMVGGPAEVRITAIAPDGTSVTRRLSRDDIRGRSRTVSIPVWFDDTPPPGYLPVQSGTYRIRLTAVSGVTVDTATFVAGGGSTLAITETTAATGNVSWEHRPDRVLVGENGETRVGVVVENRGAFHTTLSVTLETPEGYENRHARGLFPAPGERIGIVYAIPEEAAREIRTEHDGVVTVKLFRSGDGGDDDTPVATAEVPLPENSADQ